jgi:hypothetical protein
MTTITYKQLVAMNIFDAADVIASLSDQERTSVLSSMTLEETDKLSKNAATVSEAFGRLSKIMENK